MSFDGIVTQCVIKDLQKKITGGKINKVNQPDSNEIIVQIYNKGLNYKLLLSASSDFPRIYLTGVPKTNPVTAPNFCMLLRKHLIGGIITNVHQNQLDRTTFIDIKVFDELGLPVKKTMVIEIMGKHSNIILVESETNRIIDSIKRVSFEMSRVRQIYPGKIYHTIETNKINILSNLTAPSLSWISNQGLIPLFKFFYQTYMGFSPLLGKEICFRAGLDMDRSVHSLTPEEWNLLDRTFSSFADDIRSGNFLPTLIKGQQNRGFQEFHCLDIQCLGSEKIHMNDIHVVLDQYYMDRTIADRIAHRVSQLKRNIHTALNRMQNKLSNLELELQESKDRNLYRIYGDLLAANSHLIQKGMTSIQVDNFYSEKLEKVTIPLDEKKSPWENTQQYYKKFTKLKHANQLLQKEIPTVRDDIAYLEQVLSSMDIITEPIEIDEIKDELMKSGFLKNNRQPGKKAPKESKPLHFITANGSHIYVGKNNKQNDHLTMKFANREDLFLHARNIPGSHVILRGDHVQPDDIKKAAYLAAYYSNGKNEKIVLVDMTEKKHVKKSASAKPGMVFYDHYMTIQVDMQDTVMDSLEQSKFDPN